MAFSAPKTKKYIFTKSVALRPNNLFTFKKGVVVNATYIFPPRLDINTGLPIDEGKITFHNGGLNFTVTIMPSKVQPYGNAGKYIFTNDTDVAVISSIPFSKGTVVNGTVDVFVSPIGGQQSKLTFYYNGNKFENYMFSSYLKPYNVKDSSKTFVNEYSSIEGDVKTSKYKVVKGGFNYNGNVLKLGEVFEGKDTGAKFLDSPAITITYLGQSVNVPKENLVLVGDADKLTDTKTLEDYNSKRDAIKSVTKIVGLGGGLFLAHKMKKGTWGYVGFGLLGIIAGTFVGGQIANIVIKD